MSLRYQPLWGTGRPEIRLQPTGQSGVSKKLIGNCDSISKFALNLLGLVAQSHMDGASLRTSRIRQMLLKTVTLMPCGRHRMAGSGHHRSVCLLLVNS